jgi:branched-chain amino acid transport system substrate-binding protein
MGEGTMEMGSTGRVPARRGVTNRVLTRRTRARALALGVALVVFGGTACSEPAGQAADTPAGDLLATACEGRDLLACARTTSLAPFVPDAPVAATGEPIVLGMVNQENTPVGSFPDLSAAVRAAAAFVNAELGGVGGRPIEVEVCNTNFSAEGSTACGQRFAEAGVPVVLGGIDVFGNAIDVLEANGVPYVGGIPVSSQSARSTNSFQWSGGTWGATVAFADHAATVLGADTVAIVYGEFGSITDAADYGRQVLESRGITTRMVPHPIITTDLTSPMTAAAAANPDAVIVLGADTGCKAAFDAVTVVGITVPVFYTGACVSPAIIASVPAAATEGATFNVENPVGPDTSSPDFDLYVRVVDAYGQGLNPIGAPTVAFRSFMNLYVVLAGLADATVDGGSGESSASGRVAGLIDAPSIVEGLRAGRDAPSFMGHPYTCDGEQLIGLPAMCSPQQILTRLVDGNLQQVGTWIDVGSIYAAAVR